VEGGGFRLLNEALLAEFVFPLLGAEDLDADELVETEVARLAQFTLAVANSVLTRRRRDVLNH
jgi:hypothetical protein